MSGYEMVSDEKLISDLREGDQGIMDYLMEKYKDVVRKEAKAMFLLGGDSDDLIQEGMIGLFKAVRDYDPEQKVTFLSFAKLCIRRQMYSAIDASKRQKHIPLNSYISLYEESETDSKKRVLDTIEAGQESDPEQALLGKESLKGLEHGLAERLSDLERKVLYLHLIGTDYRTIAGLLDKSPKSIDNALQRIRGKVEKLIHEQ